MPQPGIYDEQMGAVRATHESLRAFHHEALFYRGDDEFLDGTVPFVREGVSAGEPALVAVDPRKAERMKADLGEDAEAVQFVDMPNLGRNPARIIPAWRDFVKEHLAEGSPVRGIGEPIWPGRSRAELMECQRHEWLLNLAFADSPAWRLVCPYDAARLEPEVLEAAQRTHPHLTRNGHTAQSDAYCDPLIEPDPFAEPLSAPTPRADRLAFTVDDLPAVRRLVSGWAVQSGLDETRSWDLVIAVSELASNSVRHGGGSGIVSLWRDGDQLVCEVRDAGLIEDPLAGRERPEPRWPEGRGLWITHQLCDLSQIRSLPEGNVARIQVNLN